MTFDYHVMWNDRVVDRATTERVAVRVCEDREILGRAFLWRTLSILHVPSGAVLARHDHHRGWLPGGLVRRGNQKLTEEAVLAIRQRRAAGEKGKDLAEEFGVSPSTISRVARGLIRMDSHEERAA